MDNRTVVMFWIFVLFILTKSETHAQEYCTKYSQRSGSTSLLYCSTSCCGTVTSRYCCFFAMGDSLIAGIVVACLVAFAIALAVICYCKKKKVMNGGYVRHSRIKISVLPTGNNTQPQVYSNNLGGPAPPGYYSGNQTGQPQPGYYDNQSGPQQPGFHNAQPGTQTGFNNYGPFAHTQGYESSNPTGKIEPAYPPPYSTVSVQPYTGSGVPPPFPYQDPVSPGMQGNPVMMDNSMSNAGNAQ